MTMMSFPPLYFCALVAATVLASLIAGKADAEQAASPLLRLEAKIPLGDVRGRIDHMAIDLSRQRLFVAELGNDSVGIVDLKARKVIRTIDGMKEPQGVGYVPPIDALYVSNAGDGSVRAFRGADYAAAGQIDLGDDADNIRIDSAANQVFVGYGSGGLAVIDAKSFQKVADIPLRAHPESFQLDPDSNRIFVNLPDAHAIAVVDRRAGQADGKLADHHRRRQFSHGAPPSGAASPRPFSATPPSSVHSPAKMARSSPARKSVGMPTTCSSTPSAAASTSVAAKDIWTCSTPKQMRSNASRTFRRSWERGRRSLLPSWTGFCSP